MVEENIGLAHLCARRFLGRGMEYDDLFQAGCVGLLKAVENFDTSRGVKFSTYAVPVILGEIRRLFRDGGALRVSRGLRDLSRKALEEADKLRQETGESPSGWVCPWRRPPWRWGWARRPCPSPMGRRAAIWTSPWRPPRRG